MKLKTVEFDRKVTETDIELPVYLYFQDEFCNDELHKIEDDKITIIKTTNNGTEMSIHKHDGTINPLHLKSMTTKEHYDDFFSELMIHFNTSYK